MSSTHEPVLSQERYLRATVSGALALDSQQRSDLDVILAAAYAARGDRGRLLALRVYRARSNGSRSEAIAVSEDLAQLLRATLTNRYRKSGHLRCGRTSCPSKRELQDMCLRVLAWMHSNACPVCQGRGHPLMPGAPVLNTKRRCNQCAGTGTTAIERAVYSEHTDAARALVEQVDAMCTQVFADMAKILDERRSIFGQRLAGPLQAAPPA